MLNRLEEYVRPKDLKEAWEIYNSDEKSLFITGGLSVSLREDNSTSILIDLNGIIPRDFEKQGNKMRIGGGMTVSELIDLLGDGCLLKDSLKSIGSLQIRNMSSISGGIAQKYSWSDLITILMAMDCDLEIYDGEFSYIPLEKYIEEKPKGIIHRITIDSDYNRGRYFKFSRTTYDVSIFNTAVFLKYDEKIMKANIICGARPSIAKKMKKAGEYLVNKMLPLKESEFEELINITNKEASFKGNSDASEQYRYKLLESFLSKVLK